MGYEFHCVCKSKEYILIRIQPESNKTKQQSQSVRHKFQMFASRR